MGSLEGDQAPAELQQGRWRAQLALRRQMLDGGAKPLGWKVAFNIPPIQELLGIDRPLAGFLTTDGLAEDGGTWPTRGEPLVAEPEVAVEEHLYAAAFRPLTSIPRFLPYSFSSRLPASERLTAAYLRLRPAWRLLGRQYLVIAERR